MTMMIGLLICGLRAARHDSVCRKRLGLKAESPNRPERGYPHPRVVKPVDENPRIAGIDMNDTWVVVSVDESVGGWCS